MKRLLLLLAVFCPTLVFGQVISWKALDMSQFTSNNFTLSVKGTGLTNVPATAWQGAGGAGTANINGTPGQILLSAGNGGVSWGRILNTNQFTTNVVGQAIVGSVAFNGGFTFNSETAPTPPTVAVNATAGNLNGVYYYRVVFQTATGVTEPGTASASVSPNNQQVDLSSIPIGSANVVNRLIYRCVANDVTLRMRLAGTISNNTATTLTDNTADVSLGAHFQGWNSTSGIISNATARLVNDKWLIALGSEAGKKNNGGWNVFIGRESGEENTAGYANTMVGDSSFMFNTNGTYNSGFGQGALANNIYGNGNIGIGLHALVYNKFSHESVAVGNEALVNSTEGGNIGLGTRAGSNLVGGSRNIIIGDDVDAPLTNYSEQLNIGNLIFGTGLNGTGTNVSTGKIGIGTASPFSALDVVGDVSITGTTESDNAEINGLNFKNLSSGQFGVPADTVVAKIFARRENDTREAGIAFQTADGAESSVLGTRMYIQNDGNVGIGTTNPAVKLDVVGNIRASTTITATNGFVFYALDNIPTNSIPASTSTYTNWVMLNWTNTGPVWIATNIAASGSFLRRVPTTTLTAWP